MILDFEYTQIKEEIDSNIDRILSLTAQLEQLSQAHDISALSDKMMQLEQLAMKNQKLLNRLADRKNRSPLGSSTPPNILF